MVLSLLVAEDLVMAVYLSLLTALLVGGSAVAIGASIAVALGAAARTLLLTRGEFSIVIAEIAVAAWLQRELGPRAAAIAARLACAPRTRHLG